MPRLNVTRRLGRNGRNGTQRNGTALGNGITPQESKMLLGNISSYFEGLANTKRPAEFRARDPLANHPWVFAAAAAIARTAGQAPFTVFRRTREKTSRVRCGRFRRSLKDYTNGLNGIQRSWKLLNSKEMSVEIDHPISSLLDNPNPYQQGSQLIQLTLLWLSIRGECFWVMTDEDGIPQAPLNAKSLPTRLWPVGPDAFTPIRENGLSGEVVGWVFEPPNWMPGVKAVQHKIPLDLSEVVQFKTPNPSDPTRGLSPITAVAQGIQTDLKAKTYNERILDNQGKPTGVLSTEQMLTKEERDEILGYWKDRHEGPENAARVAMLFGGLKWTQIALSPQDLEFLATFEWDREEILAVIGTPPSVIGLPNKLNYATQLGQDRNFWDKTVLPYDRLIETTIDKALFFPFPDDIFGMFNLNNVEAMRLGIAEKINMADKMCGQNLHTPPSVAYKVIGLEVPEYSGSDTSLVGVLATPLEFALEPEPEPLVIPAPAPAKGVFDLLQKEGPKAKVSDADAVKRQQQYRKLAIKLELKYIKSYRSWVNAEQTSTLKRFDSAAAKSRQTKAFDLGFVLGNLFKIRQSLKSKVTAISFATADATHVFDLFDIPTFELNQEILNTAVKNRLKIVIATVPKTLRDKLRKELEKGLLTGESFDSLRRKVVKAFGDAKATAHATTIARTEVGGIMSEVRHNEFVEAGIKKTKWSDSGDEHVREDHNIFTSSGVHKIGFNYASLVGDSGTLAYPLDSRGSAKQVIACRCAEIAVE